MLYQGTALATDYNILIAIVCGAALGVILAWFI